MDIDHVSFAPTGGAGLVAKVIRDSQVSLGHDSRLLTLNSGDLRSRPLDNPRLLVSAVIDDFLIRTPKATSMISLARRQNSGMDLNNFRDTSLIHLHWLEGVISHRQIGNLLDAGRKVVWTLHDMAPFTGGCHSSFGCFKFEEDCGGCPQVRSVFRPAVSKSLSCLRQVGLLLKGIRLVAPSIWLADRAKSSSVFKGCEIEVISNPISLNFFRSLDHHTERAKLGLEKQAFVGIVVAAQLNNPIKRVRELVDIFFSATSHLHVPSKLILVGSGGEVFSKLHQGCIWMGALESKKLAETIAASNVLISASESESAGMTIIEAAALGVPSIVVSNGGSDESVDHIKSGHLVRDVKNLFNVIRSLSGEPNVLVGMGREARLSAQIRSHPDEVARQYIKLYESI
jgi:glycosyltransferase involved in cell wall biosynthesis